MVLDFEGLRGGLVSKVCTLLQWDPEARGGVGLLPQTPLLEHLWEYGIRGGIPWGVGCISGRERDHPSNAWI